MEKYLKENQDNNSAKQQKRNQKLIDMTADMEYEKAVARYYD